MLVETSPITDTRAAFVGQLLPWLALLQVTCSWVQLKLTDLNAWVARMWAVLFKFLWILKILPLTVEDWLMKLWVKLLIFQASIRWIFLLALRATVLASANCVHTSHSSCPCQQPSFWKIVTELWVQLILAIQWLADSLKWKVATSNTYITEKLRMLGWTSRPMEETLHDSVECYRALGILNWASIQIQNKLVWEL
jgi:hypothetical protein